jgi:hypothetical protein
MCKQPIRHFSSINVTNNCEVGLYVSCDIITIHLLYGQEEWGSHKCIRINYFGYYKKLSKICRKLCKYNVLFKLNVSFNINIPVALILPLA